MKTRKMLFWMVVVVALTMLACSQSGEVLSVEEATRRAEPTPFPTIDASAVVLGDIEIGKDAILVGRSFIVNLLDNPEGGIVAGESRGTTVTVLQSVAGAEDVLWYQVESSSGQVGWVRGENLEAKAEEGADPANTSGQGGLRIGDEFTITGKLFLVNILEEPSPVGRIIGGVARGEGVTVVQVTQIDGKFWYQVDTSAGEGWVSEDNVLDESE
jgi:hypothetical protein